MRVHSNIAETPTRRLKKQYDNSGAFGGTTHAVGVSAPTLIGQAMGIAGHNGIVSFIASDGGTQNFTLYEWSQAYARINSGNGWAKNGNNVNSSTQSCDAAAKCSFQSTEGALFCLVAAGVVTDLLVSGSECGANPNTDTTSAVTH